ncbi:acyl-CoA dehydrogenase NM domain-like protein [Mycena belliarum]|uniref:Acyl-CoA dehydrogenase NM domain-like protein n=1 Tax=Mycena belliarum TaxID=1033014 RepID=A0AAD6Y2J1_9AGAR|nr:acyl-CoA dehydrogenase NM domain-like protein [Mycena belliae]
MWPTHKLVRTALFRPQVDAPAEERILLSYARAREIVKAYGLTVDDIVKTSRKFWIMHTDPVWTLDGAAGTLITIQINLCAGTLGMYIKSRPDLQEVLDDILQFKVSGQFCLTELGHGLDAVHIETTATLLSDGSFELNTPHERAAKFMPPTSPIGIPCVAVVWARAMVGGEDYGIKPFLVHLNDGHTMSAGVVSKLLPQRGGSHPLNHSLTYFYNVRLPAAALLGSRLKPKDPRLSFFTSIFRVAVGTLALGSQGLAALQVATYITAQYSRRRTVTNNEGGQQPIIEFRTQHTPIAIALAQSYVLNALHQVVTQIFSLPTSDGPIRHGIATILKVVTLNHTQRSLLDLMERCGAQGLFEMNQLSAMHKILQGAAIAEGDSLVLSIRLATEILLDRYTMIPSADSESLLARHEIGVFESCRERLAQMSSHRSADFSRFILPQTLRLVEALGHRIAYDAAVSLDVDQALVDLYVVSCIKTDPAWYAENVGLTQHAQQNMESAAVEAVLPRMWDFIQDMGIEPYATAPIVSQDSWVQLVASLKTFDDKKPVISKL